LKTLEFKVTPELDLVSLIKLNTSISDTISVELSFEDMVKMTSYTKVLKALSSITGQEIARILIAGAPGEIGCYLARKFVEANLEVIELDKISCDAISDKGIKLLEVDFSSEPAIEKVGNELNWSKEVTFLI